MFFYSCISYKFLATTHTHTQTCVYNRSLNIIWHLQHHHYAPHLFQPLTLHCMRICVFVCSVYPSLCQCLLFVYSLVLALNVRCWGCHVFIILLHRKCSCTHVVAAHTHSVVYILYTLVVRHMRRQTLARPPTARSKHTYTHAAYLYPYIYIHTYIYVMDVHAASRGCFHFLTVNM